MTYPANIIQTSAGPFAIKPVEESPIASAATLLETTAYDPNTLNITRCVGRNQRRTQASLVLDNARPEIMARFAASMLSANRPSTTGRDLLLIIILTYENRPCLVGKQGGVSRPMNRQLTSVSAIAFTALSASFAAHAQDGANVEEQAPENIDRDTIVVAGTRFAAPASELPISITIIDADEIQSNPVFAANIQNGLSQLIPGGTLNEVGSSDIVVRGRGVSYRVNGVELNQRGRGSDIAVQDLEPSAFG